MKGKGSGEEENYHRTREGDVVVRRVFGKSAKKIWAGELIWAGVEGEWAKGRRGVGVALGTKPQAASEVSRYLDAGGPGGSIWTLSFHHCSGPAVALSCQVTGALAPWVTVLHCAKTLTHTVRGASSGQVGQSSFCPGDTCG